MVILMSKYTTQVRFICESKAGLEESTGANSVDTVLTNSWDKIFTTNCTFFDNNYRPILCKKILKHFYLREISAETAGIWMLWMNTKLEEIMPYYNQLYNSALLQFDPFKDTDYTREHTGENVGSKNTDTATESTGNKSGYNDTSSSDVTESHGNSTSNTSTTDSNSSSGSRDTSATSTASSTGNKGDRYSDTPQGAVPMTDVSGNAYLTNVRLIDDTTSGSSADTSAESTQSVSESAGTNATVQADTSTQTGAKNETNAYSENNSSNSNASIGEQSYNTDTYIEHVFGKTAATPYSELLNKFRETFLNIDMLVIEEFNELFLQLW